MLAVCWADLHVSCHASNGLKPMCIWWMEVCNAWHWFLHSWQEVGDVSSSVCA